ncbi:hypothetical protein O181_016373 [Austropuccinia psidii MF-1]|uniref:Protoporphyrinogen oxidase n=1 Tax=Austropuccinia psidii MF-1 TaxID=1389203 RepID=A0A9Q3C477_9BASI|nr:hypothetical protein [Austropuccinia psidii MF-1]
MMTSAKTVQSSWLKPLGFHHSVVISNRCISPRWASSKCVELKKVGILGGGLAGLTTAYYLARRSPSRPMEIIVLEKANRFGGWIKSHKPDSHDGRPESTVQGCIFESGPRSVRPKGLAGMMTLDLIKELGLFDSLIVIPKSHPSAKNRYIFTPSGLQKLPSSIFTLLSTLHKSPINRIPKAVIKDLFQKPDERVIEDESIQEFIERRFGSKMGEEIVSAMVHGIYAGDYRQLSARSTLFGPIWELERKHGGVLKGLMVGRKSAPSIEGKQSRLLANSLPSDLTNASVWGLQGGLETVTNALLSWLEQQPNVYLKSRETIISIQSSFDGLLNVTTANQTFDKFDHLVSALPPQVLHSTLPLSVQQQLEMLTVNPMVTVGVVNLAYHSRQRLIPIPPAFGYLIPASIGRDLNPHGVLGVVFDSDMMPGLDQENGDQITKLTVMLGGHHYSRANYPLPSAESLVQQAAEIVKSQFKISERPIYAKAHIQKDCIPQYLVGHHQRMTQLHVLLQSQRISVVGSGYGGVGVNDVVRSSREAAEKLLQTGNSTGLESHHRSRKPTPWCGFVSLMQQICSLGKDFFG